MARGLDVDGDCAAQAAQLKAAGYEFVARYYKITPGSQPLTLPEAEALSRAGLFIVAVWENGFPTGPGYFSFSRGVHDGTVAYHYALHTIGQPPGTPIYFAVDYDASASDLAGSIHDYFRGVAAGFQTISGGAPAHPIGVYGSGYACSWLRTRMPTVEYAWLAQASGWCGYASFTEWNVKQGESATVAGLEVDLDETCGDGGGFKVPV